MISLARKSIRVAKRQCGFFSDKSTFCHLMAFFSDRAICNVESGANDKTTTIILIICFYLTQIKIITRTTQIQFSLIMNKTIETQGELA
jgi:hypothetical protein